MPLPASRLRRCAPTAALVLLGAGMLLLPDTAQAQFNPQELLKQVLPGNQQPSGDAAAPAERACQRYAENKGLDVRRVVEAHRAGANNIEVTLSVESRNDRYEALCVYDTGDGEVRELQTVSGSTQARNPDRDDEVDERLAQRARKACNELAKDRNLQNVDLEDVRARGRDTVEVAMRARNRGAFTCLYDDDQRQPLFAQ